MDDDTASLSDPDETIADRVEPGGLLEPEEADTDEEHLPEALHEKEGATQPSLTSVYWMVEKENEGKKTLHERFQP